MVLVYFVYDNDKDKVSTPLILRLFTEQVPVVSTIHVNPYTYVGKVQVLATRFDVCDGTPVPDRDFPD